MGQVTPDGTGDTMVRNSFSYARSRYFRFHFIHDCESLEARLLFSGDTLPAFSPAPIAAEWGVAAIHAPDVWTEGFTGRGVIVAVVDTGVALAHPDLAGRLWTNEDEVPGNGRDDDANGLVDDTGGWDFLDADNRPDDPAGHGTHIAGIIAAGVAAPDEFDASGASEALGVAPDARLMPIRVLDGHLRGANRDIAAGIRYAVDNGADIINLSIGGAENSAIRSALEYAGEHDVLVVAAAGNDRASTPSQPAIMSKALDNVISTGAFRESGERLSASNLVGSSGAVQIDAPGQAIRSTFVTAKYGYQSGTSMAAPHVAGLAALLLSANPSLSAAELRSIIVDSADPPAVGSDSAGRVNAVEALTLALQASSLQTPSLRAPPLPTGEPIARQDAAIVPSRVEATPQRPVAPPTAALSQLPVAVQTQVTAQLEVGAQSPASFAPHAGLLILPPAVSVPWEPSHVVPHTQSPAPRSQPDAQRGSQESARSLRDAALLAYRVDTGGSAMTLPLDDNERPATTEDRKARKPEARSSAVATSVAGARPRPGDAAAAKTVAR